MSRQFIVIDAEQRSPAWFAARCGRLTGSVAHEAFAKTKSGWSTSRRNLMLRLVLERVTGKPQERGFVSQAMQDGIDREPLAFAAFEARTGQMLERSGFLQSTTHLAGCSLDAHIGDFEELVSIKCRQPAAHLEFLKSGEIPADSMTQMRHEMWITGVSGHHYVSFNPDFPASLQLRIVTIRNDAMQTAAYYTQAKEFLDECEREYEALITLSDPAGRLAAAVEAK